MDATFLGRVYGWTRLARLFSFGLTACLMSALVVAQLSSTSSAKAASDAAEPEDELKAATVLAFLQNANGLDAEPGGSRITLGVLGRPAFFHVLSRTIEGKPVNGRPVHVVEVTHAFEPRCCQVLYVAADRHADIRRALEGAAAGNILTIGESSRFLDAGGAINIFLVDGHMAFEVSMAALDQCRVAVGSKLLRFGRVRDMPKQRGPG